MPQAPCAFYRVEDVHPHSQTIMAYRNPAPVIKRWEWCAHPRAEHYRYTIRPNAPCGGDLERCMVPLTEFRRF